MIIKPDSLQERSNARLQRLMEITTYVDYASRMNQPLAVAGNLLTIYNEKLYLEGYETIYDYALHVLHCGKGTTNNYLRVARRFLNTQNGLSVFADTETGQDLPFSCLIYLLPIKSNEDIKALFRSGHITLNSSVSEIKAAVEAFKTGKAKIQADEERAVEQAAMEPIKAAYEDFHKAYNKIKARLIEAGDKETASLMQEIMDAVVVIYAEKIK